MLPQRPLAGSAAFFPARSERIGFLDRYPSQQGLYKEEAEACRVSGDEKSSSCSQNMNCNYLRYQIGRVSSEIYIPLIRHCRTPELVSFEQFLHFLHHCEMKDVCEDALVLFGLG